jgi:dimethylamine--corrinoid protein Co-methyltransferase
MGKIFARYGDGTPTEMSTSELRADLEAGTEDAADRGKIPPLSEDELNHLFDIFSSPYKFISVEPGQEIVLTYDGAHVKMRRHGLNVERIQGLRIYEKVMGADTLELCHVDYSFKSIKPIVTFEQPVMEQALLVTHAPLFYGAMPNLNCCRPGKSERLWSPMKNPSSKRSKISFLSAAAWLNAGPTGLTSIRRVRPAMPIF